jgi:hypothetical protein
VPASDAVSYDMIEKVLRSCVEPACQGTLGVAAVRRCISCSQIIPDPRRQVTHPSLDHLVPLQDVIDQIDG